MDVNWDLTMQRIVPFIDGINTVRRISELADADFKLTKRAISHLLYYGCLTLIDVFTFSAIYAVTADIASLLTDPQMQEECINYIRTSSGSDPIAFVDVFVLYCSMSQGVSVKKFCIEHYTQLKGIDVRRFIGFGVIKGILYRVHKFPVAAGAKEVVRGGRDGKVLPLGKFLKGRCNLDEICTELQVSEKEVLSMLEGLDVQIVHR
jgi:hypothetical protein